MSEGLPQELPEEFIKLLKSVTNRRARFVIDKILENGIVTTEEIQQGGYGHPPRAAGDVRDLGIPLETVRVNDSTGKSIGAYKFGDITKVRNDVLGGRKIFPKSFKTKLIRKDGQKCLMCQTPFDEDRYLQVDHRIPYAVYGDTDWLKDPNDYMLLCSSCNRTKSWSCEHCVNGIEEQDPDTCRSCHWSGNDDYTHIALRDIRRLDMTFENEEINTFEDLRGAAQEKGISIQDYIKQILAR